MKLLFCLLFLFASCELRNAPKADFYIIGHSFSQDGWVVANEGDTIACCYPYKVEAKLENIFRYRIDHSCGLGQNTLAPTGRDTVWFTERGREWVEISAWNDDGEKTVKRKYYFVK